MEATEEQEKKLEEYQKMFKNLVEYVPQLKTDNTYELCEGLEELIDIQKHSYTICILTSLILLNYDSLRQAKYEKEMMSNKANLVYPESELPNLYIMMMDLRSEIDDLIIGGFASLKPLKNLLGPNSYITMNIIEELDNKYLLGNIDDQQIYSYELIQIFASLDRLSFGDSYSDELFRQLYVLNHASHSLQEESSSYLSAVTQLLPETSNLKNL